MYRTPAGPSGAGRSGIRPTTHSHGRREGRVPHGETSNCPVPGSGALSRNAIRGRPTRVPAMMEAASNDRPVIDFSAAGGYRSVATPCGRNSTAIPSAVSAAEAVSTGTTGSRNSRTLGTGSPLPVPFTPAWSGIRA